MHMLYGTFPSFLSKLSFFVACSLIKDHIVTRTIGPRREFKEKFLKEEVKPKGACRRIRAHTMGRNGGRWQSTKG